MTTTEHNETIRTEVLTAFRRLGANRVHFALVMPETLTPARILGSDCTAVQSPVSAFCSRTLRGYLVAIPTEHVAGWRDQGHVCRECQMVARLALARHMRPGVP